MRLLGDKIFSTLIAQSLGVPVVPWSGSSVTIDTSHLASEGYTMDSEAYTKCTISNPEQGLEAARKVGFPLMIKASEGGGGKGIRKITAESQFCTAFRQVQEEVPGSPIFLMREAPGARHLEVQLLCDSYGQCITLFGRDCSIQRRHQKIIEEAPITVASKNITCKMEEAAIKLAEVVGYVNAGTVEFLYNPQNEEFYFLELNPRLQVEHPTTEMVTDVNLPAAQLQITMGMSLQEIDTVANFMRSSQSTQGHTACSYPNGHVIACRITSENPEDGFRPCGGELKELNFRSFDNTWGYFSVNSNSSVHEFSDSQFGHVFAWGPNRHQSRINMIMALKEMNIRSDFRTSIEYLISLLEHEEFKLNKFTTLWLDNLISNRVYKPSLASEIAILCASVYKGYHFFSTRRKNLIHLLSKGHLPSNEFLHPEFTFRPIFRKTLYKVIVLQSGGDSVIVSINDTQIHVSVRTLPDAQLLIQLGAKSYVCHVLDKPEGIQVIVDGQSCMLEHDHDPRSLYSPSFGKLVRHVVPEGSRVSEGSSYAEVEVMKMIMPLISRMEGVIHWEKQEGSTLEPGVLVARLTLENEANLHLPSPFSGTFPAFDDPVSLGCSTYTDFLEARQKIDNVMSGYQLRKVDITSVVNKLFTCLASKSLPVTELQYIAAKFSNQLSDNVIQSLNDIGNEDTSTAVVLERVRQLLADLPRFKLRTSHPLYKELSNFISTYEKGPDYLTANVCLEILQTFLKVEELFCNESGDSGTKTMLKLRGSDNTTIETVLEFIYSHANIELKNLVMQEIIPRVLSETISVTIEEMCIPTLQRLIRLTSRETRSVSIAARSALVKKLLPSFEERRAKMTRIFAKAISTCDRQFQVDSSLLREIVVGDNVTFDVLSSFFIYENLHIRLASFEAYIRRAYHMFDLLKISHSVQEDVPFSTWEFKQHQRRLTRVGRFEDRTADATALGAMLPFTLLKDSLSTLSLLFPEINEHKEHRNVLNILMESDIDVATIPDFLAKSTSQLAAYFVQQVSFIVVKYQGYPEYYNFYFNNCEYVEDSSIRHIEPAMAYQLELGRLSAYNIIPVATQERELHLYSATGKKNPSDKRFFARVISRAGLLKTNTCTKEYLLSECESILEKVINELELACHDIQTDGNHIFCYFMSTFSFDPTTLSTADWLGILRNHWARMWKLRITRGEIRIPLHLPNSTSPRPKMVRIYLSNLSGYVTRMEMYFEEENEQGVLCHRCTKGSGIFHLKPILEPYQVNDHLQHKRRRAHDLGTTYVYDYPELFREALWETWNERIPSKVNHVDYHYQEIKVDAQKNIVQVSNHSKYTPHLCSHIYLITYIK
jgi:acetyl-CoA carboxylase/biotin carboxylase 1